MSKALLLIDLQNDYFPGGKYPLWNTDAVLENTEKAIAQAKAAGVHIVHIQHVADPAMGLAPFFNEGTPGVDFHPRILAAAPNAPVVVKHYADSFVDTTLAKELAEHGIAELLVAGMMTQNCVTHTAISKAAEAYNHVCILADCCTTVDQMLHQIALHAVSTRVKLTDAATALGA